MLQNGGNAVSYSVAEQYVSAFGNLAKKGNSVLIPSNASDVSGMVTQVSRLIIPAYEKYKEIKQRALSLHFYVYSIRNQLQEHNYCKMENNYFAIS